MKELLDARNEKKAKKPTFIRQDAHKKKRLAQNWRKPKGSDSKMRQNLRGYRRNVRTGWGSPAAVRGTSREGLMPVSVLKLSDLEGLDKAKQGIIVGSAVGTKKKTAILEKAQSLGLTVLNIKDPAAFVKTVTEKYAKASAEKKEKAKAKAEKQKKAAAESKKKEDLADKVADDKSDEDKKKAEKKEKDKILTKKE